MNLQLPIGSSSESNNLENKNNEVLSINYWNFVFYLQNMFPYQEIFLAQIQQNARMEFRL